MQNQIELINKNIEKSNTLLKKYKLLYQNNYETTHTKTIQVTMQLIEHLTQVYNFNTNDFNNLIQSYKTDKEIINNLGGKQIANFIACCLENYFTSQGN